MISVNNAQGMMAFWTDIDEVHVLRFQEWHNFEHMAERINIPGILVGRRYRGLDDAPMFFISYETTESAVFGMQPYMERIKNPTSWTREALPHFNNNIRNTYRLIACSGRQAPQEAPYILNLALQYHINEAYLANMQGHEIMRETLCLFWISLVLQCYKITSFPVAQTPSGCVIPGLGGWGVLRSKRLWPHLFQCHVHP